MVIQADALNKTTLESCIVALITSHIVDTPLLRIDLKNSPQTGLKSKSQIMVDKLVAIRKDRIGRQIGQLCKDEVQQLNRTLSFVIGLG